MAKYPWSGPIDFRYSATRIITERAGATIVREELPKDNSGRNNAYFRKKYGKPEREVGFTSDVTVRYGVNIPNAVRAAQDRIKMQVEYMTWMTVTDVDIFVRSIVAETKG